MPIHKRLFIILSTVVFSLSSAWGAGDGKVEAKPARTKPAKTSTNATTDAVVSASTPASSSKISDREQALLDAHARVTQEISLNQCKSEADAIRKKYEAFKKSCANKPSVSLKKLKKVTEDIREKNKDEDDDDDQANGSTTQKGNEKYTCENAIKACSEANEAVKSAMSKESTKDSDEDYVDKIVENLYGRLNIDQSVLGPHKEQGYKYLCPQYSAKEYSEKKKEAKENVKDLQEKLKTANRDKLEDSKKAQEELARLNQKVKDRKEEFEKTNKAKNDELTQNINKAFEVKQSAQKNELEARNNLKSFEDERAAKNDQFADVLLNFNAVSIANACDTNYQKMAEDIMGVKKDGGNKAPTPIRTSSASKQALLIAGRGATRQNIAKECLAKMRRQKALAIQKIESELNAINRKINSEELRLQSIQEAEKKYQADLVTLKNANAGELKSNQAKYIQDLIDLQKEIAQQQQYEQQKMKQNDEHIQSLQKQLTIEGQAIAQLGPEPAGASNSEDPPKYQDALDEYQEGQMAYNEMFRDPTCKGLLPKGIFKYIQSPEESTVDQSNKNTQGAKEAPAAK